MGNFHPISLLNVYAKILANLLLPFLPQWVFLDQVGFRPGRETGDNITKALDISYWMTNKRQEGFFLSLDSEKSIDRVAWDYLRATLSHLGVPTVMVARIIALYDNPTAKG